MKEGLKPHSKGESWNHWLTKAIVFKILTDNKHQVVTEQKINKLKNKIDVIDLTDRNLIEIETNLNLKKYENDLKKFNNDWNDIFIINAIEITDELMSQIKKISTKIGL